jgi:hypothetical protein
MIRNLDRRYRSSLYWLFSRCPAGCHDGSKWQGPTGRVYRSSWRSVTLRCTQCGLQWTMTVHRLAKAAERLAALQPDSEWQRRWAPLWAEWARDVDDRRGREFTQLRKRLTGTL